jgi:L-threonylcarbamoyladenylate synthase
VVNQKDIQKAVDILRQGGLVAMPTETVYGLGGDASNPAALRKIFAAKERPIDHPLIVHLADMTDVGHWALEVPDSAIRLAEAFWPGPLTLILKKASHVSDMVTD